MAKKTFAAKVGEVLASKSKVPTDYEKTKKRLQEFCAGLQKGLAKTRGKVLVSLHPGFKAEMGQQLNVVVEIPERHYRDTLFRVYVPLNGVPVSLDFYGEQPEMAQTLDEMERKILDFLGGDEIRTRLSDYRDLARE